MRLRETRMHYLFGKGETPTVLRESCWREPHFSLYPRWDEWICLDCLLKHTEENIEKQRELGLKQGVKSAMAWRVSKMKPRMPNVARGRKWKQDSVGTVILSLLY